MGLIGVDGVARNDKYDEVIMDMLNQHSRYKLLNQHSLYKLTRDKKTAIMIYKKGYVHVNLFVSMKFLKCSNVHSAFTHAVEVQLEWIITI